MDDLLIATDTKEDCKVSTGDLFTSFRILGCKKSAKMPKSAKLKWFIWNIYSMEDSVVSLKPIKRMYSNYITQYPGRKLENSLDQSASVVSGPSFAERAKALNETTKENWMFQ